MAPRTARAVVRRRLAGLLDDGVLADVELLVSELATNSVRHGLADEASPVRLELEIEPGQRVHVRWCDHGPGFGEVLDAPRQDGTGGYGLVLVERLASRWGTEREDGFCVWFELDLRGR